MIAKTKYSRISPKKVQVVAGMIRRQTAQASLRMLKYMPKKAAKLLYTLLHSAVANAENNFGQKKEDLEIEKVLVGPGVTYKRGQSHSKGRVTPLLKRTSNITIELKAKSAEKVQSA